MAESATTFGIKFEAFREGKAKLLEERFLLRRGFGNAAQTDLTPFRGRQDNVGAEKGLRMAFSFPCGLLYDTERKSPRPVESPPFSLPHRVVPESSRPSAVLVQAVIQQHVELSPEQLAIAVLEVPLQFRLVRQSPVQATVAACG